MRELFTFCQKEHKMAKYIWQIMAAATTANNTNVYGLQPTRRHFLISGVSKAWITRCCRETVWQRRSKIYVSILWPSPRTTLYSGLTQTEKKIGHSCPPLSVRPRSGSVPSSSIKMAQLQGDKIHTKLEEVWNCLTSRISNMFEKGHNSSTTSKF